MQRSLVAVQRDAMLTHLSSNPPPLSQITTTSKIPVLPIEVLLLTVDDHGFAACYGELKHPFRCYYQELGYVYFNSAERQQGIAKVALLKCYADSVVPAGTLTAVKNATPLLRPKAIIYVGTCTGLNCEKTKLGDVVVSSKLTTNDASTFVNAKFLKLILTCAHGWKAPLEKPEYREAIKVHLGEILSDPTLVRAGRPTATAVFKGADGIYAASSDNELEWLIVTGVSASASGSELNEEFGKRVGSVMAASLVTHILSDPKVFERWPNYSGCRSSTPAKKRMASPQATQRAEAIAKNYAASSTEVNLSRRGEKEPLAGFYSSRSSTPTRKGMATPQISQQTEAITQHYAAPAYTKVNLTRRGLKRPLAAPAYTKVNLIRRGLKRPLAAASSTEVNLSRRGKKRPLAVFVWRPNVRRRIRRYCEQMLGVMHGVIHGLYRFLGRTFFQPRRNFYSMEDSQSYPSPLHAQKSSGSRLDVVLKSRT